MNDHSNENAYRPADETDVESAAPSSHLDLSAPGPPRSIARPLSCPATMLAAAILWLMIGVSCLAILALSLLTQGPVDSGTFWLLIAAAVFLYDGIKTILGTFRDPFGDGILLIGLALYVYWTSMLSFQERAGPLAFAFGLGYGSLIMASGILALIGRKQYLAWKQFKELKRQTK